MIRPSQRPLSDNIQHSQHTNIQALGGIRTHDRKRRAAVDLRLRPRGHWNRPNSPLREGIWGSGSTDPRVFNIHTRGRWMFVASLPGPLYSVARRMCELQNPPGSFSVENVSLSIWNQLPFSPSSIPSGLPRGVVWGVQTPPEIPKISVKSSIAWARRTGISISFCISLYSHTVVIY